MGEGGNDRIAGGVGAGDILTGGAGDDLLIANDSFLDSLFGDSGNDTSIADPDDVLVGVETQT
jgi:Ca2+-binding RTX toxin-like protein